MSVTVCLGANTLYYPNGGGHLWAYLNWALGLAALGCRVVWLEWVAPGRPVEETSALVSALQSRLAPYGLADALAVASEPDRPLPAGGLATCLDLEAAARADLLLNFRYATPSGIVRRFRRSALIDIDPGQLQIWMASGLIRVARHDVYFTIGEGIGAAGGRVPDLGIEWRHAPPCVALDRWPPCRAPDGAPFTTVSHWYADEWLDDGEGTYQNDKRHAFLPFLDLPRLTRRPLELALCLAPNEEGDRAVLTAHGWRVRNAHAVASTPWAYQGYVQRSLGEFSCAKPSYVRLGNAWISDRTVCYLASGKPAVVQHTGSSRFLPESAGLFRVRDPHEAARCLEAAAGDYHRHGRLARALAEEHFDARRVASRVIELALR